MMGRVQGKVALVTGGASGLGKATATALAREGAKVVIADVNEAGAKQLAGELGGAALALRLDVTSEADWQRAIAETVRAFGGLHVLVNNAGIVVVRSIEDTSVEDLRRVLAVNVEGVFLGCKHAIPAMNAAGGGSIVNLSSTAGLVGTPPFAAYSASKGAVRLLTKTVATHCMLLGYPIRCNSIHPGGMDTPMVQGLGSGLAGAGPSTLALLGKLAAGPGGQPEDVANLALFLASDEAKHVNGSEIAIDAGMTAM
jgi:3(or 17)beta-hydroxysteroid dehydrogenase